MSSLVISFGIRTLSRLVLSSIAACIITEVLFSQLLTNMQLVTWNGDRGGE